MPAFCPTSQPEVIGTNPESACAMTRCSIAAGVQLCAKTGFCRGGSRVRQEVQTEGQRERSADILAQPAVAIGLGIAVAIVHFVAARLSLVLLTKPEGVAVFWPAAGVSADTLIALGRGARWPVVAGTMAATSVATLRGDRTGRSAARFGVRNPGDA